MKKILLCTAVMVFWFVSSANALIYTETYSGFQGVHEGQSFNFGFDMWFDNDLYGVDTNSSLSLTEDGAGAFGAWNSASLSIALFSADWVSETTGITLTAWNQTGGNVEEYDLGTYTFNAYNFFWIDHTSQIFNFDFNSQQLADFETWGWGNVTISASLTNCWNYNDFGITGVSLTVDAEGCDPDCAPVPEPSTMLLLGAGLIGVIGYNRKRFAKKA